MLYIESQIRVSKIDSNCGQFKGIVDNSKELKVLVGVEGSWRIYAVTPTTIKEVHK